MQNTSFLKDLSGYFVQKYKGKDDFLKKDLNKKRCDYNFQKKLK